MENIKLPIAKYTSSDSLEKIFLQVTVLEDLPAVVRQVAAQAIAEQISLQNPPTNIIVDGRGRIPITSAQRRVQAFFTNKEDIRRAVYEAWNRVLNLTRVATGRAASSYELWFNEQKVGKTPAAVEIYIDRMVPGKDYFRIVGPVLVYGRKIYWNPKGKPRFKKRSIIKSKTVDFKLVRIRGIMDQVEQAMRRRYRSVAVAEDWVTTTALPKDGRTPGLWIGFKKRGTLLRGN